MVDLVNNLRAGAALAFGLPAQRGRFRSGVDQVAVLFAVILAILLGSHYLAVAGPRGFNVYGISIYALHLAAFMIGCYLVTLVQRAPGSLSALLTTLLSALVVVNCAAIGIGWLALQAPDGYVAAATRLFPWLMFGWTALIALGSIRATYKSRIGRTILSAVLLGGTGCSSQYLVPPEPVWYAQAGDDASWATPVDIERVYYAQPRLMADRIGSLAPERPGIADLYFLGFAGFASQDVFKREVQSVALLFNKRFDTDARSIALINNAATVDAYPIANARNLRAALGGIASVMNPEEDVLFLFLTSHGRRGGTLSVEFWPFRLNDIEPADLREMLDESGIKWRIIVISACYSGGMIESLKDSRTLVITAARRDRTSFGCSNEADFTYFGGAYFDRALRAQTSFVEAFEVARRIIATREKSEGLTPSEPQIEIGGEMPAKLRELDARTKARLATSIP